MNYSNIGLSLQSPPDDGLDEKIERRESEIWDDLERVSYEVMGLDVLQYRRTRSMPEYAYNSVGCRDGFEAMRALRAGDEAEFGRIVRAAMKVRINELAQQDVADDEFERASNAAEDRADR